MAVLQMQRISICALKKDRKQILEFLQMRGVIEINDVMREDSVFQKTEALGAELLFDKNIAIANEAIDILNTYAPEEKSMFASLGGKKIVSKDKYDTFSKIHDDVAKVVYRLTSLAKKIAENKAEILKLQTQIETLVPWMGLDIPFSFAGTKHTAVYTGTLPNEWNEEKIYGKLADFMPLTVDVISKTTDQTCVFILCSKENGDAVLETLRGNGFSQNMSVSKKAPADKKKSLEAQVLNITKDIEQAEKEIISHAGRREDLEFFVDYNTMRSEKYDVINQLLQSRNVFIMTGFIPEVEGEELQNALNEEFDVAVEFEKTKKKDDVPIALKNNGFSSPLEGTIEAFSLPGKGEIDPTMVVSLFYYMLFGLMLSDAAYGLIMVIGCGVVLLKFKNMEDSMKKFLKMFFYCGIATTFWGIMFGSYFGDVVDVVSKTFFGKQITIPALWFVPVNDPMRMLVFSMLLGVIHLIVGLLMKFYQCAKQKKIMDGIYDSILWIIIVVSLIMVLLSMELFVNILGLTWILPPVAGTIGGIAAALAALGIILTSGRESKNPFKRFLKGLYGLYGITSYLSDILSYSRLLALGLATGVICTVINKMGSMGGGGIGGAILFIVVFIFGHLLNIAINMLGAYVHANRLQYVEFFGKFYDGGGRKFMPFKVNTKYFKFKEKINNG